MSLKKNIFRVFSANFISLIVGILSGFIIPMVLSIDEYANLKTFTFYISYIGMLHFGFIDGLYIKYGGKDINNLDLSVLKGERNFLIIFELFVSLVFFAIGIFRQDIIVVFFSICIIPLNIQSLYTSLYQATGQFQKYSKRIKINSILTLSFIVSLVFLLKAEKYIYYVAGYIIVYYIMFIYLDYEFLSDYKAVKGRITYQRIFQNFKVGIFVLLGNLSVMFFYAVDRWFVKVFLTKEDFAFYSFAISMLSIINILITSISVTLYNYLAKVKDENIIKDFKSVFLIFGIVASGGYYGFSIIVNLFITKYIPSLKIIAILFAAYPFMIIINTLYVNLYKSQKQERKYLFRVLTMVFIAIVLNYLAIQIHKGTISLAIATTVSYFIWYIYSMRDFKYLSSNLKEILYLAINITIFVLSANLLDYIWGGIVYFAVTIFTTLLIYGKNLKSIYTRSFY